MLLLSMERPLLVTNTWPREMPLFRQYFRRAPHSFFGSRITRIRPLFRISACPARRLSTVIARFSPSFHPFYTNGRLFGYVPSPHHCCKKPAPRLFARGRHRQALGVIRPVLSMSYSPVRRSSDTGTISYPSFSRYSMIPARASGVCLAALWNRMMLPSVTLEVTRL